mgnify:CR=1 FL=1
MGDVDIFNSSVEHLESKIKSTEFFPPDDLITFKEYYNWHTYSKIKLYEALTFLSQKLHEYYKNKPYILVDEFDKPVNHIISVKGINNWQPDAESTALKITDFLSGCPK